MNNKFDVVVIGAGPGGYKAATNLASAKKKVLLIEKDSLGGTCVNYGCIPTKSFLTSIKKLKCVEKAAKYGVQAKLEGTSLKKMQETRKSVRAALNGAINGALKDTGVQLVQGEAEVLSPNSLKVGQEVYEFDKLVLATGSRNRKLSLPGFEAAEKAGVALDSTGLLFLEEVPKSLAIIGGGPISVEFAYFFANLGTEVTIIQDRETLIPQFDTDVIQLTTKLLVDLGVKIVPNSKILQMTSDFAIEFENDKKTKTVKAEKVLVSVGRVLNNESFAKLNLKYNERNNLVLTPDLKTSLPNVWALGDLTGAIQLSNVAYIQSDIVVASILGKKVNPLSLNNVPYALYLEPNISSIGANEQWLLKNRPDQYVKVLLPAAKLPRNHADQTTDVGFYKIFVDKQTRKILGAHIALTESSLIINEIALAMVNGLSIEDLAKTPHVHPTLSEVIYYTSTAISTALGQ